MTKTELKRWGRYVRWVANELGLKDWTIILYPDGCDEGCTAQITPVVGRKHASLYLSGSWADHEPEEQRQTIVHELIHLHFKAMLDIVRQDVCQQMSQSSYDVMLAGFIRQCEYGVDGLADSIAQFFPLPKT